MGVSEIRRRGADFQRYCAEVGDSPQPKTEEVVQLAGAAGLAIYRADILEILLHSSDVLAVVPKESFDTYGPIIHDALLAFLDGLPDERILDRALALAMSQNASRGETNLVFASKIPTLQKVGQIIARVEGDPPDVQQPPQTLETGIHTMTRDELVSYIEKDVGGEVLRKYDAQFDDRMFAETSAGTAIDGSFQPPREPKQQSFNKQPLGSRRKRFAMTCALKFIVAALDHRPD
jgi:hypothetical protein